MMMMTMMEIDRVFNARHRVRASRSSAASDDLRPCAWLLRVVILVRLVVYTTLREKRKLLCLVGLTLNGDV